jgi:tetratricopeptide (TPR) repeat protein
VLPAKLKSAILERNLGRASVLLQELQRRPLRNLSSDEKAMLADFTARCIDHDPSWLTTAERRINALKTTNASSAVGIHFLLATGLLHFQRARVAQDYEEAARYFRQLLQFPEILSPAADERAYGLYSLSRCYYKTGQYKPALEQIAILRTTDRNPRGLGSALINMLEGWIRFRLDDAELAKNLLEAAHVLFSEHKDWINVGNTLSALGRMERRRSLESSERYLRNGLQAFRQCGVTNHRYYARICRNLAKTLRLQAIERHTPDQRGKEAFSLLETARKVYEVCGTHHERADVYNLLAALLLDQESDEARQKAGNYIHHAHQLAKNSYDAVLVDNHILRSLKLLVSPDTDARDDAKHALEKLEPLAVKLKDLGNRRLWARFRMAQANVLIKSPWCDYSGAENLVAEALATVGNHSHDYLVREILSFSSHLADIQKREVVFGTTATKVREMGLDAALAPLEVSIWRHFLAENNGNEAKTRKDLHIGFTRQKRIEKNKLKYAHLRSDQASQPDSPE